MFRNVSILLLNSLLLAGCVTSVESEVDIHKTVYQDKDYNNAYTKASNHFQVITNFETRYELHGTILSQPFRNALAKRYEDLFGEPQPMLEETSNKLGFFVSLYTMNKDINDLSDQDLWNIQLTQNGKTYKPVTIKKLSKKERWQPFFAYMTPWSKEYLLLFDMPEGGIPSDDMVKSNPLKLVLTNADARVAIAW